MKEDNYIIEQKIKAEKLTKALIKAIKKKKDNYLQKSLNT